MALTKALGGGGGGGGSGTLTTVKDEGTNLSTAVVSLDFVGAGVAATGTTAVTVTIPGLTLPNMDLLMFWTSSASTATASQSFSATPPTDAFIRGHNGWITNGGALPQWIQIQLPVAVIAKSYAIMPWWADNYPGRTPKTWTFAGSNDGSTWTTLDTQTNYTAWASASERTAWSFTNTTAYSYYRWTWTANNGNSFTGVGALWIFGVPS